MVIATTPLSLMEPEGVSAILLPWDMPSGMVM
jgi:hypothetical protein